MNKPVAVSVALALILVGIGAYFWFGGRDSEVATYDPNEAPNAEVSDVMPSSAADLTSSIPRQDSQSPDPPPSEKYEQEFPLAANNVGMLKEFSTRDFSVYLVFMTAGDSAEIIESTGEFKDEMGIRALQQEYELNDEELQELLKYSRAALQSDREHQAKLQEAACSSRATFSSLSQFGEAVNEITRSTRVNQEDLARQAESALGQALFSKISSRVGSRPLPELTEVDFPSLLTARNHGLSTEIERFCSYGN